MKKTIALVVFTTTCLSFQALSQSIQSIEWTEDRRTDYQNLTEDENSWDTELLEMDKQLIGLDMAGPFELAAYPVPRYELTSGESEVAVGSIQKSFTKKGETFAMNSFTVYRNAINAERLGEKSDEVFFHILVRVDSATSELQSAIISRNHPDYFGQGYISSELSNIEYAAFITAEGEAYAIVNTRLFNLKFGRSILVNPQEDGTLRFLQMTMLSQTAEEIINYSSVKLWSSKVSDFFQIQ